MSDTKPCPRCGGTGQVSVSQSAWLAAAAWEAHADDDLGFIKAIRTLRGWTGMGLKDAKDAIEAARTESEADA